MSRPPLRLIHSSDWHFHHAGAEEAIATARALCRTASAVAADAVVVAGDVFDSANQPAAFVDAVADALSPLAPPLVAIPGNHDIRYSERDGDAFAALFARLGSGATRLIAGPGEHAVLLGGALAVWGRGMPEHTRANDPLAGITPHDGADRAWHVALAHGELVDAPGLRASPIVLGRHESALAGFDYLALGHEHDPYQRVFGATRVAYSGSTSHAIGSGTVAVVDLVEGDVRVTFSRLEMSAR